MPRSDMTTETVVAGDLARLGEVRRLFEEYAASLAIDLSLQSDPRHPVHGEGIVNGVTWQLRFARPRVCTQSCRPEDRCRRRW